MNKDELQKKRLNEAKEIVSQLHKNFPKKEKNNQASDKSTKYQEAYFSLRSRAIRYIGIDRGKSFGQVKRVLLKKFPEIADQNPEIFDQVIQDLIADKYLDEYICAKKIVKRHSGRSQKSKEYLRQLMIKQGISEQVINDAILEVKPDSETAENYRLIKQKEWNLDKPERVMRHLASRGFSAGISRGIVQKWLNDVKKNE